MTMARDRSRVAAATAAVVPFHCVICFGEFSTKVRIPVVLPCGHTYVCAPCSKRLKRCMECREPLFYTLRPPLLPGVGSSLSSAGSSSRTITAPPQAAPGMYSRPNTATTSATASGSTGGRISPTPAANSSSLQQQTSSPAPESYISNTISNSGSMQIPFPLPKNVVLISMMEAAERHAREASGNVDFEGCDSNEDETNGSMNALDEEEEFDLNRIIGGMATLSGPCGTYAVKDPAGLRLLTSDPRLQEDTDESTQAAGSSSSALNEEDRNDKDITTLEHPQLSISASVDSIEIKEPSALERGQTVQVVRYENGVATLARNAGFIQANSSQLVKIGGPVEKTCRLEGVLDTIVSRRKELQRELDENLKVEESLRREIDNELLVESNHPVVAEAPKLELSPSHSGDHHPTTPKAATSKKHISSLSSHNLHTPEASPNSELMIGGRAHELRDYENTDFPFSPNSIDNADLCGGPGLPGYRSRGGASFDDSYGAYGCGAVLFAPASAVLGPSDNDLIEGTRSGDQQMSQQRGGIGAKSGTRSRSHSPDGASHHHPSLAPTLTSSFDTIDFRTGMSGHRGLNNIAKLTAGHSPIPRGNCLRMSEHIGISRVRGPLQRSSASNAPSS